MHRYLLAVIVAIALTAAACGGGSDAGPTAAVGTARATPTDRPLVKPTPPANDAPLLEIKAGDSQYEPTKADLQKLDTTSIHAAGKDYKGVTLASLAAKVSAPATSSATILGTTAAGTRVGGARLSLKDDGTKSVFFIADDGHLSMASSSLAPDQWLVDISAVVFQ
jgi:hypothetical protein